MTITIAEVISSAFVIGLAGFLFGTKLGQLFERSAWTIRADCGTAHWCDGVFYYIETENRKYPPGRGGRS